MAHDGPSQIQIVTGDAVDRLAKSLPQGVRPVGIQVPKAGALEHLVDDHIRPTAIDPLGDVRRDGTSVVFRFNEEGRFTRAVLAEFEDRLSIWVNRTHWAVKKAGIPSAMMERLIRTYDVVFSFAGANRRYVCPRSRNACAIVASGYSTTSLSRWTFGAVT